MRLGLVIAGCALLAGCGKKPVRTHLVSQPTPTGFLATSPAVSEDGRWVVYDQEGREGEVGIRHRDQGVWHANRDGFKWKTATPDGNRGTDPDISADGQWMVYVTDAPLKPQDRNHLPDVYVWRARDTNHNSLELISVALDGSAGNGQVYGPAKISPDGRYVVWTSNATNYIGRRGDPDGPVGSVFIRDRQLKRTTRIPVTDDFSGAATHVENVDFVITDEGVIYLAVETGAGLVVDDTNGERDVYAIAVQPEVLKLPQEASAFRQHSPRTAGRESLWSVELVSVGIDGALGDNKSYGGHVLLPAKTKAASEFMG